MSVCALHAKVVDLDHGVPACSCYETILAEWMYAVNGIRVDCVSVGILERLVRA